MNLPEVEQDLPPFPSLAPDESGRYWPLRRFLNPPAVFHGKIACADMAPWACEC